MNDAMACTFTYQMVALKAFGHFWALLTTTLQNLRIFLDSLVSAAKTAFYKSDRNGTQSVTWN